MEWREETRSVQYTHHYGAMASVWRVHVGVAMISLMGMGREARIPTKGSQGSLLLSCLLPGRRPLWRPARAPPLLPLSPACAAAHEKPKTRRLPSSCPDLFLSSPA